MILVGKKGQIRVQTERKLARGACEGQLLEELGCQAENVGFEVIGDVELLKFPKRLKTLNKNNLVALGWKVAAKVGAQCRNHSPTQNEQCLASNGVEGMKGQWEA